MLFEITDRNNEGSKCSMKQKTYQIVLDGIVITVTKKRIKNMYLRIKKEDGMVLISAPYQMSDLRIRRFAEEGSGRKADPKV